LFLNEYEWVCAEIKIVNGCDSTVILTLDGLPENTILAAIEETACGLLDLNEMTVIESGTYKDTLVASSGSDSIVFLWPLQWDGFFCLYMLSVFMQTELHNCCRQFYTIWFDACKGHVRMFVLLSP